MSSSTVPRTLPDRWAQCSIGQVTLPTTKINLRVDIDREVQYIDISSIDNIRQVIGNTKRYKLSHAPSRARQVVHSGDTLFATVRPYLRNIALVPSCYDQEIASTGFSVLRPASGVCPEFLFYKTLSRDFVDRISGMQYGVSYPAVKDEQVRDQQLWLPPTAEQYRIVAKIDELFSELEAGIESLKKAHAQLATYRQGVLKHAFEGRLTAHWREENKDILETPEQLLARIIRARVDRYEEQLGGCRISVNEWKVGTRVGKRPRRPAPLRALSPLPESETDRLPTLPTGWVYFRVGLLIDEPKYGTSKKCDYDYVGTGVLRIPNVVHGVINTDDLKGAHFEDDDVSTFSLSQGDILMIRSNGSISIVGKSAIVAEVDEQYLYAGYLMRLCSNRDVIIPEYLILALGSHFVRMQIEEKAKSTSGVNNINAREVQSLVIPMCSVNEQRLVFKQLAKGLSIIDALDREVKNQLSAAEVLRRAILARAFSGQLVPQDPNDESASVLLDRIKAEREQITSRAMRRKIGERDKTKVLV